MKHPGDVILSDLDDTLDGTDDELQDEDDGISSLGSSTGKVSLTLDERHFSDVYGSSLVLLFSQLTS